MAAINTRIYRTWCNITLSFLLCFHAFWPIKTCAAISWCFSFGDSA